MLMLVHPGEALHLDFWSPTVEQEALVAQVVHYCRATEGHHQFPLSRAQTGMEVQCYPELGEALVDLMPFKSVTTEASAHPKALARPQEAVALA
jgi:hypothetical protein